MEAFNAHNAHPAIRTRTDVGALLRLRLLLLWLLRRLQVLLGGGQARVLRQLLVAAAPAVGLSRQASVTALQLSHARFQSRVLLLQLACLHGMRQLAHPLLQGIWCLIIYMQHSQPGHGRCPHQSRER